MAGNQRKPKKIKPPQSKYSKDMIGEKDKRNLEFFLSELKEVKKILFKQEYLDLRNLKDSPKEYYKEAQRLYYKYIN
jgi:hypothetical protein